MNQLDFVVYGEPAPQGSKNAFSNHYQNAKFCAKCKHTHLVSISQVESSKAVKPWRAAVTEAAKTAVFSAGQESFPLDGALLLRAVFSLARPKSHYRTGKYAHLLRDDAPARPISKPDSSKLLRSTEDALTDAGVWLDDCLVVETAVSLVYAGGHGLRTLDRAGAWLCVSPVKNGIPA